MSEVQTNTSIFSGSYNTQQKHELRSGILEGAISDLEALAAKYGADAISDASTRKQYSAHIKEITDQVRNEVDKGNLTVQEGATYCNRLRDQLFVEYRRYTSAIGVAKAETIKRASRGFDYYLNKYARDQFQTPFKELTEAERNQVYYTVIEAAGRPNAKVNVKVRQLAVRGKVFLIFSALIAVGRIINAKNRVKEAARQGSIIAGGMLGGGIAGFGASFVCGPAEPVCAAVLVYIGASGGSVVAEELNDAYQDELDEFNRWMAQ